MLFFLFPKDERSIWLELNILLIFFPKNSEIRVWARLRSNFNTQKLNFVCNSMDLLFITNMLSSTSYARPYLTFKYFYHKLLHVIFYSHHISRKAFTWSILFYWISAYVLLYWASASLIIPVKTLIFGVWTQSRDMPIEFQLIINDYY